MTSSDGFQLEDDLYANIVRFLVATKEENQELFSSALENLSQVKEGGTVLTVLDDVIKGCEESYSTVTAFLVILGEIFVTTSTGDQTRLLTPSVDCLAEWILKQGGLESFDAFIKKKQKDISSLFALSSIEGTLKENIKLIGHRVDMQ